MKLHTTPQFYIYLRKSSEGEDRQVQSIDRQLDEVQKLIDNLGITVVGTFQESRSAMIPYNRPEFTKMIKGITQGKANGIICWHINRLARNPLEYGIVQQLLEDGKIHKIITKDRDYTASDNAIIFSVESSLATQYSKDLGKMVKSGTEKKIKMGIAPMKAPVGYLNTKFSEHGSNYIIKDPIRFSIVRKIWDMMVTGMYTPNQILEIVQNEFNLKPENGTRSINLNVSRATIYRILTNPFYTGMFLFKGTLHKGTHPQMVTVAEFDTVQKMLGRDGRPRPQKRFFAYTGMIRCGGCGCAITATEKTKKIKATGLYNTYVYYYCTNRMKGVQCSIRTPITVAELEAQMMEEIKKVSIAPSFLDVTKTIIKANTASIKEQSEALVASLKNRILGLQNEMSNLLQLRIANTVTDEEYIRERQLRENTIIKVQQSLEDEKKHPFHVLSAIESNVSQLVHLQENFKNTSLEGKKKIFSFIGGNCFLYGKKLIIDKPKWLEVIEKHKEHAEAEIRRWELEKLVDIKAYFSVFGNTNLIMRRLIDEVGTELLKEINTHNNSPPE